ADQNELARFDIRQKKVLLGFVKTVDLVEKQNARPVRLVFAALFSDDLADVVLAGRNGRKFIKFGAYRVRINPRQSGFPRSGRAPQNKGKNMPLFDGKAKRFARPDQMPLTDEFVDRGRSDFIG